MFWLDTTILAVLLMGAAFGALRGFLWQIARIVSLAVAVYAAIFFNDWATDFLREVCLQGADGRVAQGLAYVMVFAAIYLVLYSATLLLERGIRAVNLEAIDRLLGAGVGVLKMALVLGAVCLALTNYPHPRTQELLEKSQLAPALAEGMETVLIVIPPEYKSELCDGLKNFRELAKARLMQGQDKGSDE